MSGLRVNCAMEKRVPRCTGQPAATATTAQLRMAPCCPRLPVLINAQCETSGLRGGGHQKRRGMHLEASPCLRHRRVERGLCRSLEFALGPEGSGSRNSRGSPGKTAPGRHLCTALKWGFHSSFHGSIRRGPSCLP